MGRTLHNFVRIDVALILKIHREAIESGRKEELQFRDAVRDEGCLPSICEYEHYDSDAIGRAAYYLHRIATRHPFIEGNKRTAYLVAMHILSVEMKVHSIPYDENKETYVKLVASGLENEDQIRSWLEQIISCSKH